MSKKINACFLRVSILFYLGSISSPALAATVLSTWTPGTTDFNSAANWSPAGAPTTTNYAVFSGVANPSLLPQLTANTTILGLTFTNAATGYTISTANNSVLTLSSAYSALTTALQTPAIWAQNTTGTNRISAGLALAAATSTWNQAKGGTLEVTGNISESGGSRQLSLASGVGTGTTSYYYLSGSNSYTGATVIASGALLTLGSANVLGTTAGATTINGTIDLNGFSITGEAITGGGKGHDSASGFLVNNSATAASVTGSTLALSSASGNYIGGTGNMTIGSAISGPSANALTKVGTGEITLAGNNTYAGLITVSVGTLTLSGNNSGASSSISVSTGAVLNINSANALGSGTLTLSSSGTINNTKGTAVINAGNNAISYAATVYFGDINSTSANDLDLGTGTVTMGSNGHITSFAGTNTTLKMGTLDSTRVNTSASGVSITATNSSSGIGNTLSFAGFKLGSAVTNAVIDTINGNANVTFRGAIINGAAFNNGITVNNTATTTFAGDNTYTGLTSVNAGTLVLSGNNSAASGGVSIGAGGTLNINSANALGSGTFSLSSSNNVINNTSGAAVVNAGNNSITFGSSSTVTFGAIGNTASNDLNLGSGTVTAASSRTLSLLGTGTTITMGSINNTSAATSGVTFTFNGAGNTIVLGGLTIAAASPNAVNDSLSGSANITINGAISNGSGFANGLSLNGSGTTTFNGNNTYSGVTTINSGTLLKIGSATALGSTLTGTTVNSGSVLDMNGQAVGNEAMTISTGSGGISGSGSLINSSANSASLSGAITLSGNTTVGAGNIALSGNIGESGGARRLTKLGTGLLTLAGTNTYTGGTTIADGGVNISAGNSAVGTFTIDGSTNARLQLSSLNSLATSANLTGSSSSTNTGTLDLAASGSYSMNQYLGNNMKFTNSSGSAATLNFTGLTNTITSSSGSSGGRSLLNNSANLGITFEGALDIGSSAANSVTFGGVGNFTINGAVFNTNAAVLRGLDKTGTGSLTLSGTNTYNGATTISSGSLLVTTNGSIASSSLSTVNGGSLTVNGTAGGVVVNTGGSLGGSGTVGALTLNSGGLLNPGNSPGTLTAASAIVLGGSTYNWQITSLTGTAGTNWDLLSVTGLLDMSGVTSSNKWNLVITADAGFTGWTDTTSYSYVFAQAASVAGFSNVAGTDITSLFNITASGFSNLPNASSNPSGDFKVEVGPTSGGLTTLTLMTVPEPSTGALLGFGFGGLVFLRLLRRRNS